MRKIILILVLFIVSVVSLFAKENKFHIKVGAGYMGDVMQLINPGYGGGMNNPKVEGHVFNGKGYYCEAGYLLKSGYNLSIYSQTGKTNFYFNDRLGYYWNERGIDSYFHAGFILSKDIWHFNKNQVNIGIGLIMRNYKGQSIEDSYENYFNSVNIPISNFEFWDLGSLMQLNYEYRVFNNLKLGIEINVPLLWQIGIETVSVSPTISYSF